MAEIRTMPASVRRAYREGVHRVDHLCSLLDSHAYSDADRRRVLQQFFGELIRDKGMSEVPYGKTGTQSIADRVAMYKRPSSAIRMISSLPDYGGAEETLPYLARAMEPRWQSWWRGFFPKGYTTESRTTDIVALVLGDRQLVWLSAQCARRVVEMSGSDAPSEVLSALDAAESWATLPTEEHQVRAKESMYALSAMEKQRSGRPWLIPSEIPSVIARHACYACVYGLEQPKFRFRTAMSLLARYLQYRKTANDLFLFNFRSYEDAYSELKTWIHPSLIDPRRS